MASNGLSIIAAPFAILRTTTAEPGDELFRRIQTTSHGADLAVNGTGLLEHLERSVLFEAAELG